MNRPYTPLSPLKIEDLAAVYFRANGQARLDATDLMSLISEVVDLRSETESQQKQIQSLAQSNLALRAKNDGLRQAINAMKDGAE